ncbi:MAG: NAD(P)/FAD-dependent oxidoreductase [Streptomyces sp.]|nr:NAD(P)/FAD-dependent oxidoreductase [Streptomyces sp.]
MYDAIVVGARCAGATTAMLLARAGHSVLLLDRAAFPSDTMSTHYVHQPTIARLARWGLLDQLRATGCPPLEKAVWQLGDVHLEGCAPAVDGIRAAYGPRRFVLDTLLVEAAAKAGAEVREECNVTGLVRDADGRVTGVRMTTSEGTAATEHAKLVIGADGVRSTVAAHAEAAMYDEAPVLSCLYYSYWSGFTADYEVYVKDRQAIGVVPTNDDLVMVGIQWPREHFGDVKRDIEGFYLNAVRVAAPSLYERMMDGRREERFVGTGNIPNFFRQPHGPGWALVGDAGYHKDPVGAYGITDAIRHAEALASHVDDGLSGRVPLDTALASYGEQRDRDSYGMYQFNLEAARFDPAPELLDVLRVIKDDQKEVDRFFGLIAGILATDEFFRPELIQRAVIANGGDAIEWD